MPAAFLYPNASAMTLAGLIRAALDEASLILFQNDVVLGPATKLADLDVCDFSGYASIDPIVWNAVYLDPELGGASFQANVQFNFDGADVTPTTNYVYGFAVLDNDAKLFAVATFENPVTMAAAGDSLPFSVKLNYGT